MALFHCMVPTLVELYLACFPLLQFRSQNVSGDATKIHVGVDNIALKYHGILCFFCDNYNLGDGTKH